MNEQVIEILTEEASMEYFLRGFLPRVLPEDYKLDVNCFIRPHEGKSDLKKSIPKKMRAYPHFGYPVKDLIVHDQDSNDCMELKQSLMALTQTSIHNIPLLVRIACRELENWYLGDFISLENVYLEINAGLLSRKAKFRNPDNVFGAQEISLLSDSFSKTAAARAMGSIINVDSNASPSFRQFVNGLLNIVDN